MTARKSKTHAFLSLTLALLLLFGMFIGVSFNAMTKVKALNSTSVHRKQEVVVDKSQPSNKAQINDNPQAGYIGMDTLISINTLNSYEGAINLSDEQIILTNGLISEIPGDPSDDANSYLDTPLPLTETDATQLEIIFAPKEDKPCISFDFIFKSEEYPDFVNSSFKDIFIAELMSENQESALEYNDDEYVLSSDLNIAFDEQGNSMSISSFPFIDNTVDRFNGTSNLLRAAADISDIQGNIKLLLTVADIADSVLDTAIFITDFKYFNSNDCKKGAVEVPETSCVNFESVPNQTTLPQDQMSISKQYESKGFNFSLKKTKANQSCPSLPQIAVKGGIQTAFVGYGFGTERSDNPDPSETSLGNYFLTDDGTIKKSACQLNVAILEGFRTNKVEFDIIDLDYRKESNPERFKIVALGAGNEKLKTIKTPIIDTQSKAYHITVETTKPIYSLRIVPIGSVSNWGVAYDNFCSVR